MMRSWKSILTISFVLIFYIQNGSCTKPCSTNSSTGELVLYAKNRTNTNLVIDLTHKIIDGDAVNGRRGNISLSLLNETDPRIRIDGKELSLRQTEEDQTKFTLLCVYLEENEETILKEIPITIVHNHTCDEDPNDLGECVHSGNSSSVANATIPLVTSSTAPGEIKNLLVLRDSPIPLERTQRQLGQPVFPGRAPPQTGVTDKPPSFIHPECRAFGGVCADVEYTINLQPGIVPGIQPLQVQPRSIEARDLENGKAITYKFVNGTPSNFEMYFFMDPSSAAISQVRPVPFGDVDKYVINFMAKETSPAGLYTIARLIVHVDNGVENLHDPVLEASSLKGYIEENSEIGTTVRIAAEEGSTPLQILVTDEDLKPGMAPATYQYILMGIGASVFAVNQGGYVYLNAPSLDVDGASPKTYALTIQAREVGTSPIRSSQPMSIKIDVIDVNDNEPSFERQVYQASALAGEVLQDVIKVQAKDADSGKFGELQYSIVSVTNNGEKYFRYNQDTHMLVSIAPLTIGDQYQVLVQATDGGGRTGQTIVVVDVVAATTSTTSTTSTETTPMTSTTTGSTTMDTTTTAYLVSPTNSYNVTVSEAVPAGTTILRLGSDGREKLRFAIVSGNEDNKFRMDPESGSIATASILDREITPSYKLTVQAIGTTINENVTVTVNIGDENDNEPVISNPTPIVFVVEDGSPEDTFVARLRVEDADTGPNGIVKFTIDPSSPSVSDFAIDPSDGTIRTKHKLWAADRPVHQVRIVARDGGSIPKETTADVEIRVVDKSSLLPFFVNDNYVIEIDENVGPRELVTVEATAPAMQGPVTYILKQGDPTLFSVDGNTGTVSTLANLDAEHRRTHSLIIGTKQNNEKTPGAVANIEVRVKDINDWIPIFQPQSYAATLVETVQVGTPVLQVTATDQDVEEPNSSIRYRITGYGNGSQFFTIDQTSGVISVKRPLTKARNSDITLLIEARDNGSPPLSSTATAAIQIQRLQSGEAAAAPTPAPVERPIVAPDEPREPVGVKPTATVVPVSPAPTPAPTPIEEGVKFEAAQYSFSISEGADASGFVQVLTVKNKPSNLIGLQCSIATGNYGGVFSINANSEGDCELRLRGIVDRETVDRYSLNISVQAPAANGKPMIDFAQIVAEITDVNDNAPRFIFDEAIGSQKVFLAALAPDAPPESHVITVQSNDADGEGNNKVIYSLDTSSSDYHYFTINTQSGEIKNAKLLGQREHGQKPYYEVRVEAKDTPLNGQVLSAKADVIVNLLSDSNRFIMSLDGVLPPVAQRYIPDMKKSMQSRVGDCRVLGVEAMRETNNVDNIGTDIVWYAINPNTRTICPHDEFDMLFEKSNVDRIKGELSGWLTVRQLRQATADPNGGLSPDQVLTAGGYDEASVIGTGGLFASGRWQAAEVALVVLACVIVVGAIVGILAMCYFWSRYKASRIMPTDRVQLYAALPKYNALILPPSEKEYETQIMEMAVPGERTLEKVLESEFGMDDAIYRRQPPSHVYIPPPDYPSNCIIINGNGTMTTESGRRSSAAPAPAQRKRNGEKTTIL